MDLALKSERIAELSGKLNGFADIENTADRGSAANFVLDCGLCLNFASWILKELRMFLVGMSAFSVLFLG